MPSKAYIQLLQRSFLHFKRNSGRNVPPGVSQIDLIDDDDLTRWFVQLLYQDENRADFFVSLELVFSENEDGDAHGGDDAPPPSLLSRRPGPSAAAAQLAASATHRNDRSAAVVAPQPTAPQARRHDTTTTRAPLLPARPSACDLACPDNVSNATDVLPTVPGPSSSSRRGGGGGAGDGARDADVPTATTPQPYHEYPSRLVALGEARLLPFTAEGRLVPTGDGDEAHDRAGSEVLGASGPPRRAQTPPREATASSSMNTTSATAAAAPAAPPSQPQPPSPTSAAVSLHRGGNARMPLVFVVAPRLIASFIHHGALCSLELMSQHWELSPENLVLLLIALHETLNPFAGDGRVSVDEAERVESRREAAAAAGAAGVLGGVRGGGVGGGGLASVSAASSSFAGAYSQEEHQLGMDYIRRAHPHLFRRYVEPTDAAAAGAAAPRDPLASPLSRNPNIAAVVSDSSPSAAAAAASSSQQRVQREAYKDSSCKGSGGGGGGTPAVFTSDSISPSASIDGVPTATAVPLFAETSHSGLGRGAGRGPRAQSGSAAPYVVRDVSHLNTAVYDALVSAYGTAASRSTPGARPQTHTTSLLASSSPPARDTASAAPAEAAVVMLLDSPALMADAEGIRLFQSGVRGVQQQQQPAQGQDDARAEGTSGAASPYSPPPHVPTAAPGPSAPVFAPALQAERVLRARPPAVSHLVHTPANLQPVTSPATDAPPAPPQQQPVSQRVAELWIPLALPTPPSAAPPIAALDAQGSATEVVRLVDGATQQSGAAAPAAWSMEVHLVGDCADADVHRAPVACVLRNMRVSASRSSLSGCFAAAAAVSSASSPLRFSLQTSTAPSPTGDVHACDVPRGLTLRCSNMFLYGHLRILGHLVLHNCVFIGSLTTEELGSLQVSHSALALMPDDRLLQRQPQPPPQRTRLHGRQRAHGAPPSRSASASAAAVKRPGRSRSDSAISSSSPPAAAAVPPPPPPPPPALFYAARKECILVLDSSRLDLSDNTHVYRLMPDVQPTSQRPQPRRRRPPARPPPPPQSGGVDAVGDGQHRDACAVKSNVGDVDHVQLAGGDSEDGDFDDDGDDAVPAAPAPSPLAAMMTVLRSLVLVSNQGRLRLVRCTVHPGRNTERTIFAEQDAIVDMAYCRVTAAISSAVSVQGCRAYLEHCSFHGSPTTTTAATSAVLTAEQEAAAAAAGAECVGEGDGGAAALPPPPPPPRPIRVNDTTRCTGLNVELGGTLTARHCEARHLYFAFCVIAHSVAHFYRCHAADVVNGFTVDASAATLDACSAHTNHVGAFVLRKAKCILTDDNCGSFQRRCSLLGEAHEAARRTVAAELHDKQGHQQQQRHQQQQQQSPAHPYTAAESSLWMSATAVAACTARAAHLARRFYVEGLAKSDTLSDAANGSPTPFTSLPSAPSQGQPHHEHQQDHQQPPIGSTDSALPPLGFFGGRFSLEVRDAALKATGITLVNAHDTSVYAYEDSVVELDECVLWSTAEAEDAANAAAATVAAALATSTPPAASALHASRRGSVDAEASQSSLHTHDNGTAAALGPRRSASPRQRSCGVKVVQATLTARRCFMSGYSFGVAAIQSAQAELLECVVVNAINGYTVDHSRCRLRHCGADTSHVGLFALNDSVVEAESTPHVVGVSACGRTPPPLVCGGVPAVLSGDVYGVESQASEMRCTGITVLRGRDSGFNAYSGSVLRLSKCLVDMSPVDAASYVFHRPSGNVNAAANVSNNNSSANSAKGGGTALWTRQLHLNVCVGESELSSGSTSGVHGGDAPHPGEVVDAEAQQLLLPPPASASSAAAGEPQAAPRPTESQQAQQPLSRPRSTSRGERSGSARTSPRAGLANPATTAATPTTATPPSAPSSTGRTAPAMRSTGVKVWSGSQCHAQDTEVRCVTFGFASLGPETLLEAHHCTAKHVVNGFTSDGGALELTKCSASSNHVGVYVLSHAHCVVRRGSYTAKKYGIECRSGILSLQGHVKIYGFSRIGLYLYDGAHCEADPDCVLDIHALKHASPWAAASQAALSGGGALDGDDAAAAAAAQGSLFPAVLSSTSPAALPTAAGVCGPEDAANVSDLLPACIALDEATAHLPQAILGGGARCGITCGDGATGYVGKCIVYDCTLVGVNVFCGAHLTLANALLQCARQYAVVVHAGGVCRIVRASDGEDDADDTDGEDGAGNGAADIDGLAASGFAVGGLVSGRLNGATRAAALLLRRAWAGASHAAGAPWRAVAGHLQLWGARAGAGVSPAVQGGAERVSASSISGSTGRPRPAAGAGGLAPPSTSALRRRHSPSCGATSTQCVSSAPSPSSVTRTASPVGLGGGMEAAAALLIAGSGMRGAAQRQQEEIGGARTLPLTCAARWRLRWLRWRLHRHTRLPFRLNTLMPPTATNTTAGVSDAAAVTGTAASGGAPQRVAGSPAAAPAPPSSVTSAFPCVCPAITGGCVVRGTCTMERVVLRPTNVMPRLLAAQCRRRGEAADGHSRGSAAESSVEEAEEEEGGHRSEKAEAAECGVDGSAVADGAGAGDHSSGTTAAATRARVSPTALVLHRLVRQPPGVHVCQQGVLNLTDCVIDASLCTAAVAAARAAFSVPPDRHSAAPPPVTALVACEGPYAKLHCDHVRVVRGEAVSDTDSDEGDGSANAGNTAGEGRGPVAWDEASGQGLALDAAPPQLPGVGSQRSPGSSGARAAAPSEARSSTSSVHSSGSLSAASASRATLAERHGSCGRPRGRTATHLAGAEAVATVPLLLVSLVDGAQCTLHMVGTSLHDWPYAGFTDAVAGDDAEAADTQAAACTRPAQRQPRVLSARQYTAARNTGVMLRTAGDAVAESTLSSLSAVLAAHRAVVRLTHCTVAGLLPVQLGSGSSVSLTLCRVVGGLRAGAAAPAISVDGDGDLTLLRTSVWTLSAGEAVWRAAGGAATVHAIESEEASLGAVVDDGDAR